MAGNVLQFMFNLDVAMNNRFDQPMRSLAGTMDKLAGMSRKLQESAGKMDAFQKLSESVKTSGSRLEYLRANLVSNSLSLKSSRERTESLTEQYEAAKKRAADWSRTMPKGSMQLMFARKRADELGREMRESAKHTSQLEREQAKLYRSVAQAESRLSGETKQLEAMRKSLHDAGVNTSNLAQRQAELESAMKRVSSAQAKFDSIRQALGWGNIKSVMMDAYPAVIAIKAPVKLAADFESAMARVQAVGFTDGRDMEGFAQMREQALRLGAETKFTAVEAANAQEQLIRGGMTPKQAMQAMTGTLNMAAAEGMTIDQAAYIVAKGLGGMNLEATLAPRYADILAYTSSKSNTNIHNIGEAMRIAAPVAAPQGVQVEKLASYIGVLANKGFESTQAGNAISSALSRLAKRPASADQALRELGIVVKTKSGGFVELPNIMRQLSETFTRRNLGTVDQLAYMTNIFGTEYGKEMMAFMSAVMSGEQERLQTGTYIESFGWAGKMSGINLDTLNGQLEILKSSWDGLRITIGDMFTPAVRAGVKILSGGLTKVNALMKEFPAASKTFMYFLATLAGGKAAIGIFNILRAAVQLPIAFAQLKIAEHAAAMAALGTNAGTVAANMAGVAGHAATFGATLFTALGWIGGIVTASILIYENWEKITEWCTKAGQALQSFDTSKISAAKAGTLPRSDPDYGVAVMYSTYAPPEIKNAKGGIYTRPIWTWAAEKGAEAIIPLTDKSRGIPLLMQAMNILGVSQVPAIQPINTGGITNEYRYDTGSSLSDNRLWSRSSSNYSSDRPFQPTVNLTVNVTGGTQDMDIAGRIKQAVIEALDEISGYRGRVAYA